MAIDVVALALAKKYVRESLEDAGELLKGQDGKSAYQVATDNGFSGTEQEWLNSLHGAKGDSYIITEKDYAEIANLVAVSNNSAWGVLGDNK